MIISDRMDANKKSKMLPRDQKLLPKIGVFLVFQKYLKQEILLWVAGSGGNKVNSGLNDGHDGHDRHDGNEGHDGHDEHERHDGNDEHHVHN